MTVIKTSDFFDDGYKKDLKEISDQWRKLGEDVKLVVGQLKNAGKGLRTSLQQTQGNTSGGQSQIKKMAKEIQVLEKAIEQLRIAQTLYGKETVYVREQTRQKTASDKAEAQVLLSKAGSYNRLSAELKEALILIKDIDASTTRGKEAFKKSAKEIHRMRSSLKEMDNMMNSHRRNVGNYQSGLKGLMGTVKRLATVYLGFEAFRSAVRTTRDLTVQTDSLRLAYSKIIPDSAKLAKTNKFLSETAENYGIDLNSLRKNYLRFTAASRSTNLSMKETQGIFNSVAKAGAVMGLEAIRMDRAFNALEQMLSKGKVSSEELRQQLGDSLPGSMEIMADAVGVTTLELSKMLEEGKLLSEDALPKFAKQLEITYGIENLTRVENLAASQGRLKTAIIELVESMETTGAFRDFYTAMADGVKFIARNMEGIKALTKSLLSLAVAYGAFRFTQFIRGIQSSTGVMIAFNAAIRANPIAAMFSIIAGGIGLIISFKDELSDLMGVTSHLTRAQDEYNESLEKAISLNDELPRKQRKTREELEKQLKLQIASREIRDRQQRIDELRSRETELGGKKFTDLNLFEAVELLNIPSKVKGLLSEIQGFADDAGVSSSILGRNAVGRGVGLSGLSAKLGGGKDGKPLTQEEIFERRSLIIKSMQEGYMKELKLLELKHDQEDAELSKHNIDVTINDKKHFAEIMAVRRKFWQEIIDANKKAYEEEKKIEEERRKKFGKGKDFLNSVNEEYLRQFKIKQQIRIEDAKALGASKEEIELIQLGNKIELLKEELKFKKDLKKVDVELREAQIKSSQAELLRKGFGQYNLVGRFMSDMAKSSGTGDADPKLSVFGFDANKILGLDDKELQLVVDGFAIAKDAMTDYYRTAIQLSNQLVQQRNQEVASAERALDREIASRNAGYANFVDDAQKRLNVAKQAEQEALERRQELQRQQLIADSVLQASNLVTAATGILKSSINPLIAIPLITLMFGTFLGAKAKALQLTRQEFAEGDLSIIGGGRHGSGNDTLVGFQGNTAQYAERGEARMILSRSVTSRYKDVLPDLFESLNRGTFDIEMLKGSNRPIPTLTVNARTDTTRMERELMAIRRQGETQTIYDNGKKVVIKGNRIKRYV